MPSNPRLKEQIVEMAIKRDSLRMSNIGINKVILSVLENLASKTINYSLKTKGSNKFLEIRGQ